MRLHGQGHPSQILLSHRPYEAYNCTALCATPFPVLVFKSPPSFVLYHEAEIIAINQPFFKTFQYANLALASCPLHQCWHLYFYCCQQHAYTESVCLCLFFSSICTLFAARRAFTLLKGQKPVCGLQLCTPKHSSSACAKAFGEMNFPPPCNVFPYESKMTEWITKIEEPPYTTDTDGQQSCEVRIPSFSVPNSCWIRCILPAVRAYLIGGWLCSCLWHCLEAFAFQVFMWTSPSKPMRRFPLWLSGMQAVLPYSFLLFFFKFRKIILCYFFFVAFQGTWAAVYLRSILVSSLFSFGAHERLCCFHFLHFLSTNTPRKIPTNPPKTPRLAGSNSCFLQRSCRKQLLPAATFALPLPVLYVFRRFRWWAHSSLQPYWTALKHSRVTPKFNASAQRTLVSDYVNIVSRLRAPGWSNWRGGT